MSDQPLTPQNLNPSSGAAAVLERLCREVLWHIAASQEPTRDECELAQTLAPVLEQPAVADAPDTAPWLQQIADALGGTDDTQAAQAICALAEVLEQQPFGPWQHPLAQRCWDAADALGFEPARMRRCYRQIAQGERGVAREALQPCLDVLRAGDEALQASPLGRTRTLLLAVQVARQLQHEELASLVWSHLQMPDCMSIDDAVLATLRTLTVKYRANQERTTAPEGHVQVICSYVADKREHDNMARLLPLTQPQALRPWPRTLDWTEALQDEFPWFAPLTERLRLHARLHLQMGSKALRLQPTLLVGAKGIGKSSYLARLGELVGAPTMMQSLGGVADNMSFRGAARGWGTARAGAIVDFMAAQRCPNPIVMLDEIDKVSASTHNGNLWQTLLGMLEPATASSFRDDYLLGDVNYAHVNWLATANDTLPLPSALRSRFHIVELESPGAEHFDGILRQCLRDVARQFGVHPEMLPQLAPPVVDELRRAYLRTRDLRQTYRLVYDAVARAIPPDPKWLN
jgi:hypothetical protein